jgi:hypothetical protein
MLGENGHRVCFQAPTRIWVGGMQLPKHRGILIYQPDSPEDSFLRIGLGAPITVWRPWLIVLRMVARR